MIQKVWHGIRSLLVIFFQLPSCTEVEKHTQMIPPCLEDHVNVSTSPGKLFIYFKIP